MEDIKIMKLANMLIEALLLCEKEALVDRVLDAVNSGEPIQEEEMFELWDGEL